MGKNRQQGRKPSPTPKPKPASPATLPSKQSDITREVELAANRAISQATEKDLETIGEVVVPDSLTMDDIKALFTKMEEARRLFELVHKQYDEKLKELREKQDGVEKAEAQLNQDREEQLLKAQNIEAQQADLIQREENLRQRLAELKLQEEKARAGFQEQFNEVYEEVKRINTELSERRIQEVAQLEKELERMRKTQEEYLNRLQEQHESQMDVECKRLEKRRQELDEERKELDGLEARLRRERKNLERDQKLLEEDRAQFDEIVSRQVDKETVRIQDERDYFKQRFEDAEKERKRLVASHIKWDEVSRKVGREADDIISLLETLEEERKELKDQLTNGPSVQELERLNRLESENQELSDRCYKLGRELEEHRRKLSSARISVVEHEDLRNENLNLEASRRFLEKEVEDLRGVINARLENENADSSPFPQCFAFDTDPDLREKTDTVDILDLRSFSKEVQNRMASSNGNRPGLFYRDRDVRSFIAGMAMSRTMILQGISGTGKTSLPVAFSEATGGGREVIEVQAGWRDRDDLIGHYNAFEKKFYEKKFLQALYKAQCPAYANRIFIILLDEMNLSYPEQYFADLLSALQMSDPEDRKIDLIPQAPTDRPYPRALVNGKRSVLVPDNVWFIGTANRDETTKDIADKTYDRSHILELPVQHPSFMVQPITSSSPIISYTGLQEQFRKAQGTAKYQGYAATAWSFLETLRPVLANHGVGWGNRLKGQLDAYLSVYCACGGPWEEALDDIFAMKILRKVQDQYEILPGDLDALLDKITKEWGKTGSDLTVDNALERSIEIIADEDLKKRKRTQEMLMA